MMSPTHPSWDLLPHLSLSPFLFRDPMVPNGLPFFFFFFGSALPLPLTVRSSQFTVVVLFLSCALVSLFLFPEYKKTSFFWFTKMRYIKSHGVDLFPNI